MNCPACGSASVTVEPGPAVPPTATVERAVLRAEAGDAVDVTRRCWTCGWEETRELVLDAVSVEPGDDEVVARRRLLDELTAVASAIGTEGSLRELVAAVERIRDQSDGSAPD